MYNEIIFRPLYNGLIGIIDLIPWVDVGIAVIIFTAVVKLILYPLSKTALLTQLRMKKIEPEANKIKNQYANDRQMQAQKTMELYKSHGIKPFSGILLMVIQLPILFALIGIFYKLFPNVDASALYSFIPIPTLRTDFLGIIDLTKPSLILALAAAVVQFLQLKFSLASQAAKPAAGQQDAGAGQLMNSMNTQMKYVVPLIVFASIYWAIPARFPEASCVVALYIMTSSLMTFLQELWIRKKHLS